MFFTSKDTKNAKPDPRGRVVFNHYEARQREDGALLTSRVPRRGDKTGALWAAVEQSTLMDANTDVLTALLFH